MGQVVAGYTVMGKSAVQDCMGLVLSVRGKHNLGYRVISVEVKQALRPPVCWFNPFLGLGIYRIFPRGVGFVVITK